MTDHKRLKFEITETYRRAVLCICDIEIDMRAVQRLLDKMEADINAR